LADKVFSIFYRGGKQPKSFHKKTFATEVRGFPSAKVIPFRDICIIFNSFYMPDSKIIGIEEKKPSIPIIIILSKEATTL
jgi:hypothetical protein